MVACGLSESHFPLKTGRMVTLSLDIFLPQVWTLDAPVVCCWTLSEVTRFYESQGTHIRGRRPPWLLLGGAHKVF